MLLVSELHQLARDWDSRRELHEEALVRGLEGVKTHLKEELRAKQAEDVEKRAEDEVSTSALRNTCSRLERLSAEVSQVVKDNREKQVQWSTVAGDVQFDSWMVSAFGAADGKRCVPRPASDSLRLTLKHGKNLSSCAACMMVGIGPTSPHSRMLNLHASEGFAAEFEAIEEVLHPMSQSFAVDAEGFIEFRCPRYLASRSFSQASGWGQREFWPSRIAKTSPLGTCLS